MFNKLTEIIKNQPSHLSLLFKRQPKSIPFIRFIALPKVRNISQLYLPFIPAKYGMNVIDSGVPVPSMHSPWEVTSKADIYEARRGYEAFLCDAS